MRASVRFKAKKRLACYGHSSANGNIMRNAKISFWSGFYYKQEEEGIQGKTCNERQFSREEKWFVQCGNRSVI